MSKHNFRELARALVEGGCAHISELANGGTAPVGRLFVETAVTAQCNLFAHPDYNLSMEDIDALRVELDKLTRELEYACPDIHITNPPNLDDETEAWQERAREAFENVEEPAAALCAQPDFETVIQHLTKAWETILHAGEQSRTLARLRKSLVHAYIAEFKHAHSSRNVN